jgi:hypothetical protein
MEFVDNKLKYASAALSAALCAYTMNEANEFMEL